MKKQRSALCKTCRRCDDKLEAAQLLVARVGFFKKHKEQEMLRRDALKSMLSLPAAGILTLLPSNNTAAFMSVNHASRIHLHGQYSRGVFGKHFIRIPGNFLPMDQAIDAMSRLLGSTNDSPIQVGPMLFAPRCLLFQTVTMFSLSGQPLSADYSDLTFIEGFIDWTLFMSPTGTDIGKIEAKDWLPLSIKKYR